MSAIYNEREMPIVKANQATMYEQTDNIDVEKRMYHRMTRGDLNHRANKRGGNRAIRKARRARASEYSFANTFNLQRIQVHNESRTHETRLLYGDFENELSIKDYNHDRI